MDEESEAQRKEAISKYAILEVRSPDSLIQDPVIKHVHNPNESCQLSNLLYRPLGNIQVKSQYPKWIEAFDVVFLGMWVSKMFDLNNKQKHMLKFYLGNHIKRSHVRFQIQILT